SALAVRRRRGPRAGWPRPHPAPARRGLRSQHPRLVRTGAGESGLPDGWPEPDGKDRSDDDPAPANNPAEHGGGGAIEWPPDASTARAGRGARDPGAARAPEADAPCQRAAGTPEGSEARPGLDASDLPGTGRGGRMRLGFLTLPTDERRLYMDQ